MVTLQKQKTVGYWGGKMAQWVKHLNKDDDLSLNHQNHVKLGMIVCA